MQNVTITIDGVTKRYEPVDVHDAYLNRDLSIKNKWYREIEEVVKPPVDHQIISFKDTSGQSWLVSKNGEYNSNKFPLTSYTLDILLQYVKCGIVEIEAVKRLFDNQVYTVGDIEGDIGEITKICLEENIVVLYSKNSSSKLNHARKQKVTEDKNYKILAFRHTKNPNIFYKLRFGNFIATTGLSYSLLDMFKYCREGGIEVYKVKRLFDNYLITVGDVTEFGKIEKIDMISEKDCNVRYAEVKPDHRIISFRDVSGISWLVSEEGKYSSYKVPYSSYTLDNMLQSLKSKAVEIEAVSRLSDHQVFVVGNGMSYNKNGSCYTIENFILRDGKIYINGHETDKTIEDWILYVEPPVIITTEDGVKITDGEQLLYGVNDRWEKWDSYAHIASVKTIKYFSTPEARDEYILLNKPFLITLKEWMAYPSLDMKKFLKSKQK